MYPKNGVQELWDEVPFDESLEPIAADDWEIDDFDDSNNRRYGDGLQVSSKPQRYFKAENSALESVEGTVIGVLFDDRPAEGNYHPVGKKFRNYVKNLLNMISEWTGGCMNFVDVSDPRYQNRISQNVLHWKGLWRHGSAYAAGGSIFGGCSVNFPRWGRRSDLVVLHELLHCMGIV